MASDNGRRGVDGPLRRVLETFKAPIVGQKRVAPEMKVAQREDRVLMAFNIPTVLLAFPPAKARLVAAALLEHAAKAEEFVARQAAAAAEVKSDADY